MPSFRVTLCAALCAMALGLPSSSTATILLFTNTGSPVAQSYGDNVASEQGGKYAKGLKWTKHVKASYATVEVGTQIVNNTALYPWTTGYGDLVDIVYAGAASGYHGEVTLKADPGYLVKIVEFDLGGWPNTDYPNQPVQLMNGKRTAVLQNLGPLTVEGDAGHTHVTPTYGYAKKIRLQWGNHYNVGLDNLHFIEKAGARFSGNGTPEPGTWALLGAALVPAALFLRRRRS